MAHEPPLDPTLSTATLDEIFAEVKSRCDLVVCFLTPKSPEGEGYHTARYVQGGYREVIGFIETEKYDLIRDCLKQRKRYE